MGDISPTFIFCFFLADVFFADVFFYRHLCSTQLWKTKLIFVVRCVHEHIVFSVSIRCYALWQPPPHSIQLLRNPTKIHNIYWDLFTYNFLYWDLFTMGYIISKFQILKHFFSVPCYALWGCVCMSTIIICIPVLLCVHEHHYLMHSSVVVCVFSVSIPSYALWQTHPPFPFNTIAT